MAKIYRFTREELKSENASDFKHGDMIEVSKYIVHIRYEEENKMRKTPLSLSYIEDRDSYRILDCTPGTRGGWPYYLDDFLHR